MQSCGKRCTRRRSHKGGSARSRFRRPSVRHVRGRETFAQRAPAASKRCRRHGRSWTSCRVCYVCNMSISLPAAACLVTPICRSNPPKNRGPTRTCGSTPGGGTSIVTKRGLVGENHVAGPHVLIKPVETGRPVLTPFRSQGQVVEHLDIHTTSILVSRQSVISPPLNSGEESMATPECRRWNECWPRTGPTTRPILPQLPFG